MATSKVPAPITEVSDDGRPTSTPLNASPGTIVYGPAISRGSSWDRVRIDAWHTDAAAAHTATLAVIDTDGTTVLSTTSRSFAQLAGPLELVEWRIRRGLYLAVWWDAINIGWVKVEQDMVQQAAQL